MGYIASFGNGIETPVDAVKGGTWGVGNSPECMFRVFSI